MTVATITLNPGSAKPFWAGNPLVYPKAIAHAPNLQLGAWVRVVDSKKVPIGYGFYNPNSLYRVRLLAFVHENIGVEIAQVLDARIQQAIGLRAELGLPNATTNCYRLINSEGDRLSGLTVDVLGNYVVLHVTAYWVLTQQTLLNTLFLQYFPDKQLIWRLHEKSLQQEGGHDMAITTPVIDAQVHIQEAGIEYAIDITHGQKTGFYCDQRETRALVQSLARDKTVLDLCCFNGGFALNAAQGGARFVTGVDTSGPAIELAKHNATLNQLQNIAFIEQDVLQFLAQNNSVDFIILDPPKLAPTYKHINNAKRKYLQFNKAALQALAPGGLLLTCSCSQAMKLADLIDVLLDAALACQKNVQILKSGGAGPDHPYLLADPHGQYLKWLLVRV